METTGGVRSHIEADAHRALATEGLACAEVIHPGMSGGSLI